MKNKNDKGKNIKGTITRRIEALLASLDMLPLHLSQKTRIDNAVIYKCLHGKRKWNLGHLEKIAPVLNVAVADLIQEPIVVRRAGGIKGGQGPPQSKILRPDQGGRPLWPKEDTATLAKIYDLMVEDRSMMPSFPPGTLITAQRDTASLIKNENFVVYWDEDGQTYIRQIFFSPNRIILRSLTQGIADKMLPLKHIALCDKVFRIEFPA